MITINASCFTEDGYLDISKIPLDSIVKNTVSENDEEFNSSCRILMSMSDTTRRREVSVILFGLLSYYRNNLERKERIVEALRLIKSREVGEVLLNELHITDSSNTTRKYINAILASLQRFPTEIIREGMEELLLQKKWSYRMKNKFKTILYGEEFEF